MLVDTSVWINHFRHANTDLEHLLEEGRVVTHPFVIGELACGSIKGRDETLRLLGALPVALVATDDEVMTFITRHRLQGTGIGWVDVHLLASARLSRHSLWSADRPLREAAVRIGVAGPE